MAYPESRTHVGAEGRVDHGDEHVRRDLLLQTALEILRDARTKVSRPPQDHVR